MWNYDGLETLNDDWAEEARDEAEKTRLKAVREFSPAWWREMDLRYGMHPPAPESHQDFTVALGLLRTQANVVASSAPGMVASCRLCHSTVLFTNPDPKNPEPRFAEGIPNAFLDFERFHQNVATSGGTNAGFLFAKNLPRFFVDSADFFGILVPVVRPDGIKPSILRFDKIFIADHGSNYTKKLEAQVPLIPFLKPQPWTNYTYKTGGTEGQGLYVDGGFEGNVADVTYAMAISRDHLGKDELVSFPNKLVDHEELGTDPLRITGVFDMDVEEKKRFLKEQMERDPYVRIFDPEWRSPEQWESLREALESIKHLKVDPSKPELYTGMLNTGHTFGDDLTEEQRLAVLEFLKCL